MTARGSWSSCAHRSGGTFSQQWWCWRQLLAAMLLMCVLLSASAADNSRMATCPTAGKRALERHPTNATKALLIAKKCEQVAIEITTAGSATELDVSARNIDVVVDYPTVSSLYVCVTGCVCFYDLC